LSRRRRAVSAKPSKSLDLSKRSPWNFAPPRASLAYGLKTANARKRAICEGDAYRSSPWAAPIYGWFTEGFGTPDLREAEALLETLR
jgi:hypothetical protein